MAFRLLTAVSCLPMQAAPVTLNPETAPKRTKGNGTLNRGRDDPPQQKAHFPPWGGGLCLADACAQQLHWAFSGLGWKWGFHSGQARQVPVFTGLTVQ